MKKKYSLLLSGLALIAGSAGLKAQNIAINTTGNLPFNSSVLLDLSDNLTNGTVGFLAPYAALTASNVAAPLVAPPAGLIIYNTATAGVSPNNVIPGYYYWDGAAWQLILTSGGINGKAWTILGNSGTVPSVAAIGAAITAGSNFLGTTDNKDLVFALNNGANTLERMRIKASNGNIGVANLNPTTLVQVGNGGATGKLSVNSQDFQFGQIQIGNPNANSEASMQFISNVNAFGPAATSASGNNYSWNIGVGTYGLGGQKFIISNLGFGPIMTFVTPTGNVGIGNVAPSQNLSVQNGENIDMAGTNNGFLNNGLPTGNGLSFGIASGEGIASKRTGGGNQFGLDFYTNFINRMSLTNGGFFGIGTTAPAQALEVAQTNSTVRIDGIKTGNTFYSTVTAPTAASSIMFANNTTGDVQALAPSATNGQVLTQTAGGPAWQNAGFSSCAGTVNYLPFYNTASTVCTSLINQNAAANSVGIDAVANGVDGLLITGAAAVNGLNATTTKAAAGSYGIHASSLAGNDNYLGYVGTTATIATVSVTNPVSYHLSTINSGPAMFGGTNGGSGSAAIIGTSNAWHGLMGFTAAAVTAQGVYGVNEAASGVSSGGGVTGVTFQAGTGIFSGSGSTPPAAGIQGFNDNTITTGCAGISGTYFSNNTWGSGIVGTGYLGTWVNNLQNDMGVTGLVGNTLNNGDAGVEGVYGTMVNTGPLVAGGAGVIGSSSVAGAYAVKAINTTGVGNSGLFVRGSFTATGAKAAVVPTSKGYQKLYCNESPGVWFEDYGTATLVNGQVVINLDSLYLETVTIDKDHPMMVFVQEQGDCNGLYVQPGTTSFTVNEKSHGTSNVTFSYHIMAKRRFYQNYRFGNEPVLGETVDWSQYKDLESVPVEYQAAYKYYEMDKKHPQKNQDGKNAKPFISLSSAVSASK